MRKMTQKAIVLFLLVPFLVFGQSDSAGINEKAAKSSAFEYLRNLPSKVQSYFLSDQAGNNGEGYLTAARKKVTEIVSVSGQWLAKTGNEFKSRAEYTIVKSKELKEEILNKITFAKAIEDNIKKIMPF